MNFKLAQVPVGLWGLLQANALLVQTLHVKDCCSRLLFFRVPAALVGHRHLSKAAISAGDVCGTGLVPPWPLGDGRIAGGEG
jgi:hypothetical protein